MPRGVRNVQVPGQAAQAEPQAPKGTPENQLTDADAAADLAGEPRPSAPDAPKVLRAADVDPSKLKRAVLTADGWVCPEKSPAPAAKE